MAIFKLSGNGTASAALEGPVSEADLPAEDQVIHLFTGLRIPILRHLMWMNLRPDEAEDVLQEAFLRLYQQLLRDNFPRDNLRGWVWRVAHNLGVNIRRAANRKENSAAMDIDAILAQLADPKPSPEQQLLQRQWEANVHIGIQLLNERDRQCVHLRAQGLGYREIASMLGIGRSTVADTLERVTRLLRSCNYS
jgi:RNA polymerase sigma-70 factor (ECF subfamily)